jgi:ADP-ribose pyrophosphatase
MASLEWTRLVSSYILKDRWLSVRIDSYRLPDGHILEPCYVLEYPAWVNVVALTRDRQLVLVRQYRPGAGRLEIELPCGIVDPEDASPLAAAQRELLEETGYGGGEFVETGCLSPNAASHTNLLYSYLVTGVERVSDPTPDATEHIEVVLMPLDEVVELAKGGRLLQALHLTSLFLALARLGGSPVLDGQSRE